MTWTQEICGFCGAPVFDDRCSSCGRLRWCTRHHVEAVYVNHPRTTVTVTDGDGRVIQHSESEGRLCVCPQCPGGKALVEQCGILDEGGSK